MDNLVDVLILGGGPAGLTAAIYTARAALTTLLFEGVPAGGQLMLTTEVENFPGFPNGILGPDFILNCRKQAEKFGTKILPLTCDTTLYSPETKLFTVVASNTAQYFAKTVIVATGASAKWLDLPNEQRLRGKGVSACATCDGFFFKDKVVAVVGGGDSAMEEALYLTKFATKIYILVRASADKVRASKFMVTKALNHPKITFLYSTEVVDVLGEDLVTGVNIKDLTTGSVTTLSDVEGLFLAIGHTPNSQCVRNLVPVDSIGYIQTTQGVVSQVPGLFIAGDVSDHRYRQAITAAGFGCMAALEAERFLSGH